MTLIIIQQISLDLAWCLALQSIDKTTQNFSLQIINLSKILAYLVSESSQRAVSPASLQSEDLEGRGDNHLLLFVIGRRNSLECLQTLESILSSLGFVGAHTTHSPPEDLGRSSAKQSHDIL